MARRQRRCGFGMSEMKTPGWLRNPNVEPPGWLRGLDMILGLLCISLTVGVLAYPNVNQLTQVLTLVTALLVLGLARIIIGVFARHFALRLRALNIVLGIFDIVVTFIAILNQQFLTQTLIQLFSFALLFHGAFSVIIGRFVETLPGLARGALFVLGLLSIASSVVALLFTPLPFSTSIRALSVGYLSGGITLIVEAVAKLRRSK